MVQRIVQQGRRVVEFVAAYGRMEIADAMPAVMDAPAELAQRRDAAAGVQEWARHCWRWSTANREALSTGLTLARQAAF